MGDQRIVPMKLFATWEMDRSSASSCVPRICTMKVNRLVIVKVLEPELSSLVFAVKLQGNKRTLRSNDVSLPSQQNGGSNIEVDLDISFTLQYPHFIKKKNNIICVMLQRRKKYKNRPILGFKTLAIGSINLTEVLQRCVDLELCLFCEAKEDVPSHVFARIYLINVSSSALDQEDSKVRDADQYSDEDEDDVPTSDDGGSDSEPILDDPGERRPPRRRRSHLQQTGLKSMKIAPALLQGNLKQKLVSLLKKFKVSEEVLGAAAEGTSKPTDREIEALFEELDELSPESGPEMDSIDTISVKSTPKPGLRPYFNSIASSREALPRPLNANSEESRDSDTNEGTDAEGSDVPSSLNTTWNLPPHSASPVVPRLTSTRLSDPSVESLAGTTPSTTPATSASKIVDKRRKLSTDNPRNSSSDNLELQQSLLRQVSAGASPAATASQSVAERNNVAVPRVSSIKSPRFKELSLPAVAHKPISTQLASFLPAEGNTVPGTFFLLSAYERCAAQFADALVAGQKTRGGVVHVIVSTASDIKTVFGTLLNRVQRFCNSNNVPPTLIKFVLFGSDRHFSRVLRIYTELMAQKPSEWLQYIKFFIVSTGSVIENSSNSISRYLCSIDSIYASLFSDSWWLDRADKADITSAEATEMSSRVFKYIDTAQVNFSLPISEAMLQFRERMEDQSQIFVPFIMDLRVGGYDLQTPSNDPQSGASNEGTSVASGAGVVVGTATSAIVATGTSPPASASLLQSSSPPASPHAGERHTSTPVMTYPGEAVELQIDYWTLNVAGSGPATTSGAASSRTGSDLLPTSASLGGLNLTPSGPSSVAKKDSVLASGSVGGSGGTTVKSSLKTAFRHLCIATRAKLSSETVLLQQPASSVSGLTITFTKEKKLQAQQKVLQKLGMKNKDKGAMPEERTVVGNVCRVICMAKQHTTIKVVIDGVEWTNVKFFQVSSQWQTHVKMFPIALLSLDA